MLTIPTTSDPLYSQLTPLTGRDYLLTFKWNRRESYWYMDIADQDGNLLAVARKIVVDYPLLPRRTNPLLPSGLLMAIDTSGAGLDPGQDDFGTRVLLMYAEPDEVTT